jgi:hypothetical protein
MDAGMALGTARLLRLPIDHEGLQVIALACPSLPAIRPKGRPDDVDLVLGLGSDEEVRIDIAAVEQVCPWEEIPIGQVLLNGWAYDAILRRGRRRDHLRDEIRVVGIF